MKTRGNGIVGYNVQTAVATQNHLIVTHEVTNVGSDRDQLGSMAPTAMRFWLRCVTVKTSDWGRRCTEWVSAKIRADNVFERDMVVLGGTIRDWTPERLDCRHAT